MEITNSLCGIFFGIFPLSNSVQLPAGLICCVICWKFGIQKLLNDLFVNIIGLFVVKPFRKFTFLIESVFQTKSQN